MTTFMTSSSVENMSKSISAIIIHGSSTEANTDCTERNWFQWLKRELIARGVSAVVPQFPTPVGQSVQSWMEKFRNEMGEVSGQTILIGHSTGAALILNVLNEAKQSAMATFLAGGFIGKIGSPVFDPMNRTFFEANFDWNKVKRNAGQLHIYAGDNDPYVPLNKGIELAKTLSTELILIPDGGHLNQAAGFTSFPRLLRDLDILLQSNKAT